MSRRDRRSWGRRALKRNTNEKTLYFFELHRAGYSRSAIAAKLNMPLKDVDRMFAAMERKEEDDEAIAKVGGGGSG